MNVEQKVELWWNEDDFPVRCDSQVNFLVDGRHTMWTMCLHFLTAKEYVYLANWGITATIQLVRGSDHRAGPDGSPEQNTLLEELRKAGLSEQDIEFWTTTSELTLQNVLGYVVKKGIDVRVLLWACPEAFSHYSPKTAHEQLTAVGVNCLLDDSATRLAHLTQSLHQKISIVDGQYAFVGGIDPLIELSGDFDRWDTPWHNVISQLRANEQEEHPHTWHDAHAMITGTAALDVAFNFYQRWNEVANRREQPVSLLIDQPQRPAQTGQSEHIVQIARTIPPGTYNFAPAEGIQGIAHIYAQAFNHARNFIYIENQYLWLHTFLGLNIPELGPLSPDMERNFTELAQALERGATLTLILPDHPNVGRAFTDAGLDHLRKAAPQAEAAGRIQAFCLANSAEHEHGHHYRPIYVHAKVAIIDDAWSTIGSANLNNRGMRDDAEINVAIQDHDFARSLRIMLLAEHLGLLKDNDQFVLSRYLNNQYQHEEDRQHALGLWRALEEQLSDPQQGLRLLLQNAQANLERFRQGRPLVGHLFPYLTAHEAHHLGLRLHESHGLFETP